jgi:hypothetical protein
MCLLPAPHHLRRGGMDRQSYRSKSTTTSWIVTESVGRHVRFPITLSARSYRFIIGPMEGTLLPRLNMHDAKALSYWV